MKSVVIELSEAELAWCQDYAGKIVEHYGGQESNGSGSYNHNNISSNLVGFKSEVALKQWILNYFVEDHLKFHFEDYLNPNPNGDIQVFTKGLEVKGLRPYHWDKFKRCIPPRQLKKYVKQNSIAVWTTATGDVENNVVELKGWNYATEVDEMGVYRRTICDNIWLKEDKYMRSMDSLIEILVEKEVRV